MTNEEYIRKYTSLEDLAGMLVEVDEWEDIYTSDGCKFLFYEDAIAHEIEWLKSERTE